jgi:hypothetical protein
MMNEAEQQLRNLVKEACEHPPGSIKRQRGLTQIIRLTMPKLWREASPYYADAGATNLGIFLPKYL